VTFEEATPFNGHVCYFYGTGPYMIEVIEHAPPFPPEETWVHDWAEGDALLRVGVDTLHKLSIHPVECLALA
jgi:hypothetical protein